MIGYKRRRGDEGDNADKPTGHEVNHLQRALATSASWPLAYQTLLPEDHSPESVKLSSLRTIPDMGIGEEDQLYPIPHEDQAVHQTPQAHRRGRWGEGRD